MIAHLFALTERLLPRLLAAGMVFVLAALTNPGVVGVYTAATLLYTAIQALSESAVRQVLPRVILRQSFMARYISLTSAIACSVLVLGIGAIWLVTRDKSGYAALVMLPLALAPALNARGLPAVGQLQANGRWAALARSQLIATFTAFVLTVPITFATGSSLGAALYLPLAEGLNALLACRASREVATPDQSTLDADPRLGHDLRYMALYSGGAWLQGQADRVLLGLLSGASTLGTYSVASSLARSLGDPLAASTANLLRVDLSRVGSSVEEAKSAARRVMLRGLALATGAAVVSVAFARLIAAPILGPQWHAAINVLPILALTCIPSALNWSGSALQVHLGRARSSLAIPIVGVLFAPVIAIVATHTLDAAAWIVLAREFAVCITSFAFARRIVPWAVFGAASAITAAAALLVQIT